MGRRAEQVATLVAFYAQHDATKTAAQIEAIVDRRRGYAPALDAQQWETLSAALASKKPIVRVGRTCLLQRSLGFRSQLVRPPSDGGVARATIDCRGEDELMHLFEAPSLTWQFRS